MSPESVADLYASLTSEPNVTSGPALARTIWVLLGVSLVVVVLRLFTKFRTTRRLYIDDVLMVIALILGLVYAILIQIAISHGFGRHIIYIERRDLEKTMKIGAISIMFGLLSAMFGRISFCFTLLFLSGIDARVKSWPIVVFIFLQTAVNTVGIIVFYAQCGPDLDAFWNPQKQARFSEYCWDPRIQTNFGYFMGTFNTLTDVFLAVLPAILIQHSRLSNRSKLGIGFLLCLSVLAMLASIAKTFEAKALSKITDYTYSLSSYVIVMVVELNVVIVTSSIPLLRPLFRRKHPESDPPLVRHSIPLNSPLTSQNHSRTNTMELSGASSLKPIVSRDDSPPRQGITVTREVEISYEPLEVAFVHAALVGLIQGERANPHLVRR